jgi:hypothetical protein
MMSLWDALRMNMMISYQELVRTFPKALSHTPEINNAEFYDNVIARNFPDRFSRFSGGNNPVPCHADLLAKAINPCGLAFGQLRCIGKNAAYPGISLGNLNSDIYAWDPDNRR